MVACRRPGGHEQADKAHRKRDANAISHHQETVHILRFFDAQIVTWLRAAGPVAMGELTKRFKKRLQSDAERKAFGTVIKSVATHKELTPGAGKVIVLKQGA